MPLQEDESESRSDTDEVPCARARDLHHAWLTSSLFFFHGDNNTAERIVWRTKMPLSFPQKQEDLQNKQDACC